MVLINNNNKIVISQNKRNDKIFEDYHLDGMTFRELGVKYGMSRENARLIVTKLYNVLRIRPRPVSRKIVKYYFIERQILEYLMIKGLTQPKIAIYLDTTTDRVVKSFVHHKLDYKGFLLDYWGSKILNLVKQGCLYREIGELFNLSGNAIYRRLYYYCKIKGIKFPNRNKK